MKQKNIYIIRHGETALNKKKWVQGSGVDSRLNELGQAQAHAFYSTYGHVKFDRVFTSKLIRTHESVQSFIDDSIPWVQLWGLNEISWGDKEGRKLTAKDDQQYFDMIKAWNNGDYTQKSPGGESPLEVAERQQKAWEYIMSYEEDENILVCMHGRAIRILLCGLLRVPMSEMDIFKHQNLCLYQLSYTNGLYKIEKENDTSHLASLFSEAH
ncbi:histidine phosphatase family protein [Limibacter armeniacum]|uniref:histidine phosphatase family protein n=1 Tax=Limibacter armeniacum TaxID=466084 RepID=UPI002FE60358